MKIIPVSRRRYYLARVGIFLVTAALSAGMGGCDVGSSKYSLTMAVAPSGRGTATDLTNASPYAADTWVTIKAEANEGYLFAEWTAPVGAFTDANAAETSFKMPAQDVIVTAIFVSPLISTWYDLDAVRDNLSGNYTLINDLDSTTLGYEELASPTANQGKGWQPIGNFYTYEPPAMYYGLTGTFDGQGYEIRDLFINRPDDHEVGLFGAVGQEGVVENIGVVNATVTGNSCVGSLVGWNLGTVSNSYSSANVTGYDRVGGLVGITYDTVANSYSTGSVTGYYDYVGGLVGGAGSGGKGENSGIISNSYSTASVSGDDEVGGLVGENFGSLWEQVTVSDSYAIGSVTGKNYVGGLVGWNRYESTVSNSYSTGNVTGEHNVGGLMGCNTATVSNSFWNIETSGQASSAGGTGKNTTEMQDIATFSIAGWDIIAVALNETNPAYIWNIVNSVTYPFLGWQP